MKEMRTSHLEGIMRIDPDNKITAATNCLLADRNGWRVPGSFDSWEADMPKIVASAKADAPMPLPRGAALGRGMQETKR